MRDKRVTLIIVAVLVAAVVLAVFGPSMTDKINNSTVPGVMAPRKEGVSAKGRVESSEEILLSSQVTAVVEKVYVDAGDNVEKGQLLLEFDTRKIEAQLQQRKASVAVAQAKLADAQAGFRAEDKVAAEHGRQRFQAVFLEAKDEYERLSRLLVKDAVTLVEVKRAEEKLHVAKAQLQEAEVNQEKLRGGFRLHEVRLAEAAYDLAKADVNYAESLLDDYKIYAPISGLVGERFRDRGESTDIETPLFKLINPALARIRAELEETEVGKVQEGQDAQVSVDAYPGKRFDGVVSKVFPLVRKKTQKNFDPMATLDINTQEIHIKLQDSSLLKNGMTVTVRFQ